MQCAHSLFTIAYTLHAIVFELTVLTTAVKQTQKIVHLLSHFTAGTRSLHHHPRPPAEPYTLQKCFVTDILARSSPWLIHARCRIRLELDPSVFRNMTPVGTTQPIANMLHAHLRAVDCHKRLLKHIAGYQQDRLPAHGCQQMLRNLHHCNVCSQIRTFCVHAVSIMCISTTCSGPVSGLLGGML